MPLITIAHFPKKHGYCSHSLSSQAAEWESHGLWDWTGMGFSFLTTLLLICKLVYIFLPSVYLSINGNNSCRLRCLWTSTPLFTPLARPVSTSAFQLNPHQPWPGMYYLVMNFRHSLKSQSVKTILLRDIFFPSFLRKGKFGNCC